MSEEELLDAMCQAYWRAGPGIRISMRSILELLHANGYRRCAEGQKVTQWCDRAEKAEAEVERLRASCDDYASHKQRQDERIIELQAEVERLRADAERYRWLRGEVHGPHVPLAQVLWKLNNIRDNFRWTNLPDGQTLDEHIDAARGES